MMTLEPQEKTRFNTSAPKDAGFTLIEMLVSLFIFSLIKMRSLPSQGVEMRLLRYPIIIGTPRHDG